MAATRVRDGGTVNREATGNLVIASFQHGTSRAQDPQLHTHNVIMNATKGEDGAWRSLEPRAIYQLQKQIGAVYRQELALNRIDLPDRLSSLFIQFCTQNGGRLSARKREQFFSELTDEEVTELEGIVEAAKVPAMQGGLG